MFGIKIIGQEKTLYLKADMVDITGDEIKCFHNYGVMNVRRGKENWESSETGKVYEMYVNSEKVIGGTK